MQKLFKHFSFPGGIPSHVAPELPGSLPFDRVVLNGLDRYHLVMVAIDQLSGWGGRATYMKQIFQYKLIEHRHYVETYGQDMLEVSEWQWSPTQEQ